ncbi:cytochrome c oxidase subunit II [Nitrosovibrio sp. Nv6]|uniref:cytochrome c oxidase subunit II n=1 Tax=Nitrosovibrio sp. Nv6 TaxID=1855340 RepID=UPI0008BC4343|nr:cytochrome c oxidase subunit II [Nitrosovibrio sp. Nv6]SEO99614.1 cytochrome c oxidase subunit 2 [Nitrosovibrio sp. Nv6]
MGSKAAPTIMGALAIAFYSGLGLTAADPHQLNLPEPQSIIAQQIYDQHTMLLWICLAIFIGVFGVMFYSVLKHRKSLEHPAANFHHSTTVEIIWTIIPIFILVAMAYPATKTVIAMKDTSSPDITIKATGYQWKWGYDYLTGEGEGINFLSSLSTPKAQIENAAPKGENYLLEVDNRVVVPVGKKVRVLLTASDVIHAWWVPALGVKQDAIPGFIRDAWFAADRPGTYRGQCAELCGKEHGFMPIVVEAVEPKKYAQWVSEQKTKLAAARMDVNKEFTMDELKVEGEKVYAANCVACHQADGKGISGMFAALDGSKIAVGNRAEHINIVMNGRADTAMAAFKHMSDVQIAAVVTYERNAWGNTAGDLVQPSEINQLRK